MKQKIKTLASHPLISSSSVVFIGSFVVSIGSYIYNLLMGRILSVSDYGLLTSLTSLFILLGLFSNTFTNVFVKFSAAFRGRQDDAGIKVLFFHGLRIISIFGGVLLIALLLAAPVFESFLHVVKIEYVLLIIVAIIFSLFLTLPLGLLQGRMQFISFSFANLSQPVIKIVLSLVLFSIGLTVLSPLIAIVFSVFVPMVILYIYFYRVSNREPHVANFDHATFKKEFFHYSYTSFLAGIGVALLSNTDILLVRYFFSPVVSGQYAALSLMGKAIFYLILPINLALFPLIAYKKERKERLFETVALAFILILLASSTLSFIYFFFPSLVLKIFFPSPQYLILKEYLGIFSLYIMFFALATIISTYFLSVGKTEIYKISLVAAIIQIVSICLFHSNLHQIVYSMVFVSLIYFLALLGYYVKHGRD